MNIVHTPIPWKVSLSGPFNILTAEGLLVATCVSVPERSSNSAQANAEFIVSACNSHCELVEVLEKVKVYLNTLMEAQPNELEDAVSSLTEPLEDWVGAALAKAKGGK